MAIAEIVAQRSLCYRSRVGAVACSSDRRLVSVGWNAAPAGLETASRGCQMWCPRGAGLSHKPGYADCSAVHSEVNCLLHAERGELIGGTMYLTRVPCSACAKHIAASGIIRIVALPDDGGVYHRPEETIAMLETFGVSLEVYDG